MYAKSYFISDLHLGSITEPKAYVLINFLRSFHSSAQISNLFLVGDIFDLWISDHQYFIDKFKPIIDELTRLHSLGVVVHYFEGNHDLYLKKYFSDKLGFKVYTSATYFQLGSLKVRVEHGDEMDSQDKGYLFLRWLLRTSVVKWLSSRLPPAFVVFLGEKMSQASRKYTSELKTISKEYALKVIREHGRAAYEEQPFDFIISGHIHVVDDYQMQNYRVINLGSWFDCCRAFELAGSSGDRSDGNGNSGRFIELGEHLLS